MAQETLDAAQAEAAKAEIDRVRDTFQKALAETDMATLGAILRADTIMVPPGGPGHVEMRAAAEGAPFPPGFRMTITPMELEILNGEWAYEFGTTVQSWLPEGAGKPVELRNSYLILLRNDGSGWKPFREVASASPPPSGWPGA